MNENNRNINNKTFMKKGMKDGKLENNIKKMGFKEGHSKVRGTDGKSMAILSFES